MALGDGIRRKIASVEPAERAMLRDAFIELNTPLLGLDPGSEGDPKRQPRERGQRDAEPLHLRLTGLRGAEPGPARRALARRALRRARRQTVLSPWAGRTSRSAIRSCSCFIPTSTACSRSGRRNRRSRNDSIPISSTAQRPTTRVSIAASSRGRRVTPSISSASSTSPGPGSRRRVRASPRPTTILDRHAAHL